MPINEILIRVKEKYAHQPIFIQTVTEFFISIGPYLEKIGATKEDYERLERLLVPERAISFRVTWEDDEGRLQHNTGYRVQFNSVRGPYKGGLRFDASVNEDILKFLGFEQIFKNALTGLPLGGGKGGSDFSPQGKSNTEIRRFCRAFMTELYRYIGLEVDVPAGDIGVGGREIGYLYGMYKQITNTAEGALTGKGVNFGGSLGRTEATGHGAVYFVAEMLKTKGATLEGKRAVVSGAGNVATYAARQLIKEGAQVLTLSDRGGYLKKAAGFTAADIDAIEAGKQKRQALADITIEGTVHTPGRPWQSVVADIYLPCATQNEINDADAKAMVASGAVIVAEGANMPADLDALAVFKESDILFAPAKAVNAGGVAVSGLEMIQNASHQPWTHDAVDTKLRQIMANIHATCEHYGQGDEGRVDYVGGANIGGFIPVFAGLKELGW